LHKNNFFLEFIIQKMSDDSESPIIPNSDDITPSLTETEIENRQTAKKKKAKKDLSELDIEDQIETEDDSDDEDEDDSEDENNKEAEEKPAELSRSKQSKKQSKKQIKKQPKKNKKQEKKKPKKTQMKRQRNIKKSSSEESSVSTSDSENYSSTSSESSASDDEDDKISSISVSSGGASSQLSEYASEKWKQLKKSLGSVAESVGLGAISEAPKNAMAQLQNIMPQGMTQQIPQGMPKQMQQMGNKLSQVPVGFEHAYKQMGLDIQPEFMNLISQHPFDMQSEQPAMTAALGSAVAKIAPQQNPMLNMQQMNKSLGSSVAQMNPAMMAPLQQQMPQMPIQNLQMQSGTPTLPAMSGAMPVAIPMNIPMLQGGAKKQRKYKIVKDKDFFF
jgi:hypothetical protein